MPNINLRDKRNRDAVVRAETIGQSATVQYVDKDGSHVRLRKVLKATSEHGLDRLMAAAGDEAKLAEALAAGDTDVDAERVGMFLTDTSRVFVSEKGDIAFHIEQIEIVRSPSGEEKERRPRRRPEPNVESEIPISWTGKLIKTDEAVRRFVFSSKLQIVHVNGLTYDFLYGMAKELAEAKSLMLLGAGKSGKDPLIFRRGSTPHRGFLEGRIDGEKYVLLLHLSKLEMKRPAIAEQAAAAVQPAAAAVAAPAPQMPMPLPAPHKPSVAEIVMATAAPVVPPATAKQDIAETVAAAKSGKQRKTADALSARSAAEGAAAPETQDTPAPKTRARRAKPAADKPEAP